MEMGTSRSGSTPRARGCSSAERVGWRVLGLAVALTASGCWRAAVPVDRPDPALIGGVIRAPVPAPERLTGPLRIGPDGTSVGKLQHLLCTDADGARAALTAASADQAEWIADQAVLDGACADPGWFAWVRAELEGGGWLASNRLWIALLDDDDPVDGAFVVAEAPDRVALLYLLRHGGPYDPRLGPMVARMLQVDAREAKMALVALGSADDPAAEQALVELANRAPDRWREQIGLALWNASSPAAVALNREACRDAPDDARCSAVSGSDDPRSDFVGALNRGTDPARVLRAAPNHRTAVLTALGECARVAGGPIARGCALALAREDRARAASALVGVTDPELEDVIEAVRDGRGPDDVAAGVRAAGFEVPRAGVSAAQVVALDVLTASGHALPAGDTATWPPHHDRLLTRAGAWLGLDGVVFDELLPAPDPPFVPGRTPSVALYAYDGAWRYRALARSDEGMDVRAVARLLNRVLEARGADTRVAVDASLATLVAGTPDGLAALAEGRWVRFATAEPEGFAGSVLDGD